MKDGRHEQFADWITRYYSSHKYIPDGHSDGELIGKLIRCKDCIWKEDARGPYKWCNQSVRHVTDEDFCSWAERKEDEAD